MQKLTLLSCLSMCIFALPQLSSAQNKTPESRQEEYKLNIKKTGNKILMDGELSEDAWQDAEVADEFWMSFPVDDKRVEPEVRTEVKLTYDDNFIYIGATCYGPNDYIIPTLKRDSRTFWAGDVFALVIDPVNESTNGFMFAVNPAGVQVEALVSGRTGTRAEANTRTGRRSGINSAWDNKWFVETKSETDRWFVEIGIPFKSLRFDPEKTSWGINFTRGEPRTNSWHTWAPVPVQFLTLDLGYTGAVAWDQPPKKVKSNISVIPYTLGSVVTDFEEGSPTEGDLRIGGDAKIAISSSLNLDLTLNPDFSQVEVDEQVTNLTTFNIRFPERRLFFLENSDLFADFGIPPLRPFFSRRIGLDEDGNTIPILYGARLSGNLTPDLRMGAMNMQTKESDDFAAQNYTSLALHQQVLDRSVIKGYFHNRQAMNNGEFADQDYNRTAGAEFSYFSQDAKWLGFANYGLSFSDGLQGQNYSYSLGGGYDGRNISAYTNIAGIGDNYFADMGWIPFADHYDADQDTSFHLGFQHIYTRFSYTIYPEEQTKVNSHQLTANHILFVDNNLELLQNQWIGSYTVTYANTSFLSLRYTHQDNRLVYPFAFTDEESLPVGRYHFDFFNINYSSDFRKFFSWRGGLQYGSFYNGNRAEASLSLSYRVQPWGAFGTTFVYNRLDFPDPYGSGNLFLVGPRFEVNFSRNLFWTTFLQYNTQRDNFNINSRFQWRFQPMSDLFVVYTDNYAVEVWGRKNRALVVKFNYWLNL